MDNLNEKLERIEARVRILENALRLFSADSEYEESTNKLPPESTDLRLKLALPRTAVRKEAPSRILPWLKENWLIALGTFLILLAGGWFVNFAFSSNWITPTLRIASSLTAGIALYIWGLLILPRKALYAQILILLGTILATLSLYAGEHFYSFFTPPYTFFAMAFLAALTTSIALKHKLKQLALGSVLYALMLPILLDTGITTALLFYLFLTDVMALSLFLIAGWSAPFHSAWVVTVLYLSLLTSASKSTLHTLLYLFFYLLFFLPASLSIFRSKKERLPADGIWLLITTALAFALWFFRFKPIGSDCIYYLGAALLSLSCGYLIAKRWDSIYPQKNTRSKLFATILTCDVFFFILLATDRLAPFFTDYSSTVFPGVLLLLHLAEATIAVAISAFILRAPLLASGVAFSFAIPLLEIASQHPQILESAFYSFDFAILISTVISLALSAWMITKSPNFLQSDLQINVYKALKKLTTLFAICLLWNICNNLLPCSNFARFYTITAYIILAETLIYIGNLKQVKPLRHSAMVILTFVTYRLLWVEAWIMPIELRTLTFIVAGLLFIGTALFNKQCRKKKLLPLA